MKQSKTVRWICLLLSLCICVAVFTGCHKEDEETPSSAPSDTGTSSVDDSGSTIDETDPVEEPVNAEPEDDQWEELPEEPETSVDYEELTVLNTTPLNTGFRGINAIHQLYNYMPDKFNRTYNEKQIALELDTLQKMGVHMIRSFYGDSLAWDPATQSYDFESPYMQAFYQNCRDMEKIGVEVGVTAQWSLAGFLSEQAGNQQTVNLGVAGFLVPGDFEATCRNYSRFMEQSVLAFQAHGVTNVKYFFAYTECNNTFVKTTQGETTLEKRNYERLYPIFDGAITALDAGLKSAGLRDRYKIVGPCDNWRADDGSESDYSRLVKYSIEHLSDKIDIIGSHNGYDRNNEYVDDNYYDVPMEKLIDPMIQAKNAGKEYWVDEYNVAVNKYGLSSYRLFNKNPWKGVALGAMVNSVMNMGGISNIFLWTFYDQQWPNNTNSGEDTEFANGIQLCGYLPCLFESTTPYKPWYSCSLLTRYIGQGTTYDCEVSFGVYLSAIQRTDGEWTVAVTNYNYEDTPIKISFEKSMGGKTFYRHLYDTNHLEPKPGNDMIGISAIAKNVTTGFYDTLPGGSVAVYTTVKD